jgi:UDP-N-acetylmuramyl pentapeptide phosphotransferase/UDP-N-acetylglucosamine-1-phosphate transferase
MVPRVGGVSVFLSFYFGLWLLSDNLDISYVMWIAPLPVFIAGIYEDLTGKVSPFARIMFAFLSILIAFVWMRIGITNLGFEWVDYLLSNYEIISLLFTLLVVGGMVNSFNIIDGFNGILGGYSILASLSMAYIAYVLNDNLVVHLNLILCASVFGFFIFNFPFGKIFMGDGGAYFIGLMLAIIGLMLVSRHVELSNWFILLIFMYPMHELLYSIYRRKVIYGVDASQPDAYHLHTLVYRKLISCDRLKNNKVICNSMVSPFMWLLSLVGIVPAVIWFDNQTMLIIWVFVFMLIYTIIYRYISSDRFKFNH